MEKSEFETSLAVLEDQRAEAVKLHERAVVAASDGAGTKAQADEAKSAIADLDERIESLRIVWQEAERTAREARRKNTTDAVKAARIDIEKALQLQEAAAARIEANAAKMGADGQAIDESCRVIVAILRKHQVLLGGEFQHLLADMSKGASRFHQHVAGHLTVGGMNLSKANFDNAKFLVKDSKLTAAMRVRNDMARDRLTVLDDFVAAA